MDTPRDKPGAAAAALFQDSPPAQPQEFTCVKKSQIRAGCEMSSAKTGILAVGEVLLVVEQRTDAHGTRRARFQRGWVSMQTSGGLRILQPGVDVMARASTPVVQQSSSCSQSQSLENPRDVFASHKAAAQDHCAGAKGWQRRAMHRCRAGSDPGDPA